jgi:ATPase family AAA domain-containing protein 2
MIRRPSNESTNLAGVESLFHEPHNDAHYPYKIKVPPMNQTHNLRRSQRRTASAGASGSEYLASEKSLEMQRQPTPPQEPPVEFTQSRSGRRLIKKVYVESSESEVAHPEDLSDEEPEDRPKRNSRSTKTRRVPPGDEDEEEIPVGRPLRKSNRNGNLGGFLVGNEDEDEKMQPRYLTRNRNKKVPPKTNGSSKPLIQQQQQLQRTRRLTRRTAARAEQEEDFFPEPHTSSGASADADGSLDDAPHTSSDIEPEQEPELEHEPEPEEEVDGRPYSLRQRQKINYAIPPPLEDMPKPSKGTAGRNGGRAGGYHGGGHGRAGAKGRTLGWSASGAELGRWMGMPGDDSVTIFFASFKLITDVNLGFRLCDANT